MCCEHPHGMAAAGGITGFAIDGPYNSANVIKVRQLLAVYGKHASELAASRVALTPMVNC